MKHAALPRYLAAKTVALAFLLSFALFGSVLFMAAVTKQELTPSPAEAEVVPSRVHTLTLFFRDTSGSLTGAVIMTADARRLTMTVAGYAPQFEIGGQPLLELYAHNPQNAGKRLCEETGTSADGVLSFSVSNMAAFLVHLKNRLPLSLPEQAGILPAGESTLTPMQVADVLRYDGWTNGADGCAHIHAAVVAAICNRYLTADRNLEQDFKQLTSLCDDRLSIEQFKSIKDELYMLATANKGNICTLRY